MGVRWTPPELGNQQKSRTKTLLSHGRIFSLGEGKPGIRFYERFRVKEPLQVGWNRRALLTSVFFAILPHAVFHA
uniref:Uncharacterized protein n=1 Tax=Candidatus Kentrum sp. FM TaxID=2126340 RepID=A0A450TSZ3_9GAMM|nr:MAG: hypothetical protein BECKFM1743A_GA0114220_105991 [Candidatus Kentron sp. FM]VFK19614.1 MAG: hypothetical protein BECKFM1743B_GA0114221_106331 [Candidatus Kentron sp. FM]